jgi:uncharacterized protein YhaN
VRIIRLDLKRFGHFTDRSLDLSAGQLGQFGVHLIYGANEAGKSTALRALHQCFYGIPARTDDGFLHPYTALRIGAVLSRGDGQTLETLECIRRKGNQKTLRAADDETVIDDRELAAWLGGVDEETFRLRYGINYEQLVAGGDDIVKGHGDLGRSLFAAGAGIANLRDVQQRLESEAGDLFKPTGRNPRINELARDLKAAHDRVRQLRLSTSEWKKHDKAHAEAKQQYDAVRAREGEMLAERDRLSRLQKAVLEAVKLSRLESELAPLTGTPILSDEFSEQRRQTQSRLDQARADARRARNDLQDVQQSLATLKVPESLLERGDAIRQCFEDGGAIRKAARDRIEREAELAKDEADIRRLLGELGAADLPLESVESLRLPKADSVRIQNLGNEGKALKATAEQATHELARLQSHVEAVRQKLAALRAPVESEELTAAIRQTEREVEREEDARILEDECDSLEQEASTRLETLGQWQGDFEEAQRLAVPNRETCDRWETELSSAEGGVSSRREALAKLRDRHEELKRELDEIRQGHDVPTEEDLTEARRRRDEGWRLVRGMWLGPDVEPEDVLQYAGDSDEPEKIAEVFAQHIAASDETADRLRREAQRVEKKLHLLAEQRSAARRIESLHAELEAADAELQSRRTAWKQVWAPLKVAPLTPREMRAWLDRLERLVETIDHLRRKQRDLLTLKRRRDDCRQRLVELLDALGAEQAASACREASSLSDALVAARSHSERLEAERRSHENLVAELDRLETELREEKQNDDDAKARLVEWRRSWAEAMQLLGLREDADPSEANTILELRRDILQHEASAASLRARLTGIDRDAEEFSGRVRHLAMEIAPELVDDDAHEIVKKLNSRLSKAEQDDVRRAEQREKKSQLEEQAREAEREVEKHQAALAALCKEAGCDSGDDLPEVEQRSRLRREKEREFQGVKQQLEDLAAGTPCEEFLSEVREHDFDDLGLRIRSLEDELEDLQQQGAVLNQTIGAERNELRRMNGGGDAAEAEEEAQSLLAEIRSKCEEYARLKLASAVLAESIERYRQRHQGPILEKAGELFAELTLGSFTGLKAEFFDSDQPELVGVRPGGETLVRVSGMSEGTCDQLYLALRLASLEHELEHRQPLPFVVDDVLIMFDDDRSAAALKALARLSERTQVIMFTHHEHLVQLARQTLDDDVLFVQQLDAAAASPAQAAAR